jgi:2-polyprenyl-3-methyl-5-hydroxy-6-metoxy-1,4-benzoquinol methylase
MLNQPQKMSPRDFYEKIYSERVPAKHEWVAGTASPELVNLVWQQILQPEMKVLEVGSGVGTEAVFLAMRGMHVTGVDLSETAVKLGNKLAEFYGVNVNFVQGDATNLPFDKEFDVVCDQGVFHHLTDGERDTYARSIHKVLKPNGLYVLRCFSDKIPGGPQPRRISSKEMLDTFTPYFNLDHMERVLSFSTSTREKPLGWFTLWYKK